jgi:hypothetical protein
MLSEIMATQCTDKALLALVAGSTYFTDTWIYQQ